MSRARAVLDASAVLALLFKEPGGQAVVDVVSRAAVSAVNWVEVWQRCRTVGYDPSEARDRLLGVGLVITALSTARPSGLASCANRRATSGCRSPIAAAWRSPWTPVSPF